MTRARILNSKVEPLRVPVRVNVVLHNAVVLLVRNFLH